MAKEPTVKPISIKAWPQGIAESPYVGFAEMVGVDVVSTPGAVVMNPRLLPTIPDAVTGTFTANSGTDTLTGPDFTYIAGTFSLTGGTRAVTLTSTVTLPSPLVAGTTYFLISLTGTTYKLATTLANALAGTPIDITDAGTGTHTITSIDPSLFKHFAYDNGNAVLYGIDDVGRVWKNSSSTWQLITGNTLTNGTGQGLNIAWDYLFAYRETKIDVYGPLSGSPAWTNGWQTISGGKHYSFVGTNDLLYWGDLDSSNNPYVGSLQQVGTFAPGTPATYTFNATALGLPKYKTVTRLDQLGNKLMVATSGKEIYPWDRISATFDLPIKCGEKNINCIIVSNNQMYVAAGNKGNLYIFNGYQLQLLKIFPKHLLNTLLSTVTIGAMAIMGRKLLFTVQTPDYSGVFSLDLPSNALVKENTVSSGSLGPVGGLEMPCLYSDNTTYYAGWKDAQASTRGVDVSTESETARYDSGSSYVVTEHLDYGFINIPGTIQNAELYFDRNLATNQSVVLKYRLAQGDSWTTLATATGDNTRQFYQFPASTITGTDVQFRIDFNNTSSTSMHFQELRLIPQAT